ncbi:unnamed protein product [Rotaria magnacalcarata]|uniref:Uncharacterized protein n=1 Tax=Rotaria magnacalcarata TaxID=392030 RepID=A0A816QSX4_9BILA|nr:unnamed protein product [Rotaria magnacalcarata]
MNRNTDNHKETRKTPSQDAQGRWYELLSPTQKKKKCRGNRKARRLRRRERERQQQQQKQQQVTNNANQTEQSVLIIIDDNDDPEGEEQEQIQILPNQHEITSENKRKRQSLNTDEINVHRSFSQLSISQENVTKKNTKTTTTTTTTGNPSNNQVSTVVNDDNHEENNESLFVNNLKRLKPSYLKGSDEIFKRFLSNAIKEGDQIVQYSDTEQMKSFNLFVR